MNKLQELLKDKQFLAQLHETLNQKLQQESLARTKFLHSNIFQEMINTFKHSEEHLVLDYEQFVYFPEQTKEQFGWQFDNHDIELFFQVMQRADGLTQEQRHSDDDCLFDNEYFEFHGLFVFVMWGQGTSIQISNQPIIK